MLHNRGIPPTLAHSMDHWFAPVKRRGELGFLRLLHCSTSHGIITVHQSLTMLKCLSSVHQRSPNMVLLQTKVCEFQPTAASNLVSWFDKRYYQVFWMLSHAVALNGHWCSRADVLSLTWWMSKMHLDQLWFPRLVWTRDPEGSSEQI